MTSELKPSRTFSEELRHAVENGNRSHYEELLGQAAELIDALNTRAVSDVPELVRYGFEVKRYATDGFHEKTYFVKKPDGQYVFHSQAVAVIAAKDAEIDIAERDRDAGRKNFITMQQAAAKLLKRAEVAEAKNTELEAAWLNAEGKISDLEAKLAKIEKQEVIGYVPDFIVTSLVNSDGVSCYIETKTENFRPEYSYISLYTAPVASDADLRAETIEQCIDVVKRMLVFADTTSRSDEAIIAQLRALNPSESRTCE